jgi:hypothetical protein
MCGNGSTLEKKKQEYWCVPAFKFENHNENKFWFMYFQKDSAGPHSQIQYQLNICKTEL